MAAFNVSTGPVAIIERQLELLSPRDRRLLVFLFLFVGFILVAGLSWGLRGLAEDKASRVRVAKENLVAMQQLQAEYLVAKAEIDEQTARLQSFQRQQLKPYVEEVARDRGVLDMLRSAKEIGSEQVGNISQTRYRIELKRVGYEEAFGFLYQLEISELPIEVEMAEFRSVRTKDGKVLDITLELMAYSLVEG